MMFNSVGLTNMLRSTLKILNPRLINGTRPFSRRFQLFYNIGKQSSQQKYLLCTRGFNQLSQENVESTSDANARYVQMRGLPFSATSKDIINFFRPLNIEPEEIIFQTNAMGRPNGFAIVKFKTYDDALKALNKHRNYIGHRYVELSLNLRPTPSGSYSQAQSLASTSHDGVATKSCKVFLRGLPYEATVNDVIQFFAPLNIKPSVVEMKFGQSNLPTGNCECIFDNHEDAHTALKNHKAYIGRRWVEVYMKPNSTAFDVEDSGTANVRD